MIKQAKNYYVIPLDELERLDVRFQDMQNHVMAAIFEQRVKRREPEKKSYYIKELKSLYIGE